MVVLVRYVQQVLGEPTVESTTLSLSDMCVRQCGKAAAKSQKRNTKKNNTTNVVLCSTNDDLSPAAVQLH